MQIPNVIQSDLEIFISNSYVEVLDLYHVAMLCGGTARVREVGPYSRHQLTTSRYP